MSSTTTTISRAEYNRLTASAQREQRARQELDLQRQRALAREENLRRQYNRDIESVNRALEQAINTNSQAMTRLREENRRALGEQAIEFRRQLDAQRDELSGAIADVSRRTDAISNRVNGLANDFQSRFDRIDRKERDTKERANMHLAVYHDLLEGIGGLRPEKFGAGDAYNTLRAHEQSINEDIKQGDYAAGLALAQQNILEARRVLTELTLLNDEFNRGLHEARQQQSQLVEVIEGYSTASDNVLTYTTEDGQTVTVPYDINHWSNGMFEDICRRFEEVSANLEAADNDESFGIAELETAVNTLNHITESIRDCDTSAREQFFGSCNVEATVNSITEIMREEHFRLESSGAADGDQRKPHSLVFTDEDGNTVTYVVSQGGTPDRATIAMEIFSAEEGDEFVREVTSSTVRDALDDNEMTALEHTRNNDCHINPDAQSFINHSTENFIRENEERQRELRRAIVEAI